MYCFEMKGDKVDTEASIEHFKGELSDYTKSDLAPGTCDSVNWADKFMNYTAYDGVDSSLWRKGDNQATKDAKKKAAAAKKAKETPAERKDETEYHGVGHWIMTADNDYKVCV